MNYPDKIELVLTYKHDSEDTEIFTERVHAEKVGNYYKLIHIPAFAPNLAYGDIVKVDYDGGEFYFDELIKESGHSTVHIVILKTEVKNRIITALTHFCCGVNTHVAYNYLVINVPPVVSYQTIQAYLLNEKSYENIDFKESCLSTLHTRVKS